LILDELTVSNKKKKKEAVHTRTMNKEMMKIIIMKNTETAQE